MTKFPVKKGDKVVVHTGKWKGKSATIAAIIAKNDRVVLNFGDLSEEDKKKVGLRTVKKSQRNRENQTGLIERSVSVHVSNVALTEESKQARAEDKKARLAKKEAARAAKKAE